jgi:hypothetical protein
MRGVLRWRTSVPIATRLSVDEARERIAVLLPGPLDRAAPTFRQEYDAPGRAWVQVVVEATILDAGHERVVTFNVETIPRLRIVACVLLGFLLLALPVGALDMRQAGLFSAAFLSLMTATHWIVAGLVLRRDSRALVQRAREALTAMARDRR